MPHTKLKVCSVLLIIYGAGDILVALATLAVALLGELFGISDDIGWLLSVPGVTVTLVFLFCALLYAGMAVADLMAGINGFRFCNGKCGIKICRIPAIIVIVLQVITIILQKIYGDLLVAPAIHIVIAVLCIVFAVKAEQYNLTRPPVEDTSHLT